MIKIGAVHLKNQVVLAPMAGVTDPPFRKIVSAYKPGLVCSEMISAMALHYQSKKTLEMLAIDPEERPVSVQIFGSNPEIMAEAAQIIAASGADIIDINMGCPVPKVVKNGEGAALLTNLPLAQSIIKAVASKVGIPVTVKMRLGWDYDRIVAPQLAKIAEDCGAAGVTVHARTRDQFYQGKANWDKIMEVKRHVSIPVIGNGDVDSPWSALAMIEKTGCDGVMIGQAALGKPWLIGQVADFLSKGVLTPDPLLKEKFDIIFKHMDLQVRFSGEERGIREMRKHLAWYLKGEPGAARLREKIFLLTSFNEVKNILLEYMESQTNK